MHNFKLSARNTHKTNYDPKRHTFDKDFLFILQLQRFTSYENNDKKLLILSTFTENILRNSNSQ